MKKWFVVLVSCLLLFSLTACAGEPLAIEGVHAGEYMEFSSELPEYFTQFLEKIKKL